MKHILCCTLVLMTISACLCAQKPSDYVDPSIGTANAGGVVVGPCAPFGIVRPSPDCNPNRNQGWGPLDQEVRGFSQTHVSGTGGAPKYGNIMLMPFCDDMSAASHNAMRKEENMSLGYYSSVFEGSSIRTEVTSSERAVAYRFSYGENALKGLCVDAEHCQHCNNMRSRSCQVTLASSCEVVNDSTLTGYSTVRGGWNKGEPYTVYFYLVTDKPFTSSRKVSESIVNLSFGPEAEVLNVRLGISFLSEEKAGFNLGELEGKSFEQIHSDLVAQWDSILERVEIDPSTPDKYRRMFYTGIYHALLMPSDRTGEWKKCGPDEPYYDDFYCLWDTYRTSLPLITLLDTGRAADIINGLLTIYRYDGYMPDGRSGDCNGNVQGGSNSDIVIADAFVKGVKGVDYELALEAMLKNANVEPTPRRSSKEGRGGITEYKALGYVPFGISKAGGRTFEYAYCDYAIAEVAQGLGHEDIAKEYYHRSLNWRNIYKDDLEYSGMKGFIVPKDSLGNWMESTVYVDPDDGDTLFFEFTPDKSFNRWGGYFYEANCFEISLFVPHMVDSLVEKAGGREAFTYKLDRFFSDGCFDVGNEPSFLTPCLYHWAGRPDLSSDLVLRIIRNDYSDGPGGIAGNDDSGAMSSWLIFHMMGLYPNAGQDYYLIHTPVLKRTKLHLCGGKTFEIRTRGLSERRCHIRSVRLNGRRYPYSALRHSDIANGGRLVLRMGRRPGHWGKDVLPHNQ